MKLNKKIVSIFAAVLVLVSIVYFLQKPKTVEYKTAKVEFGSIIQDISETGTIKKGEEVNLNFKGQGTVAAVDVAVGETVAAGQILARLDTRQLKVQLVQAKANVLLFRTQLEKLTNGVGAEDMALGRTAVANAQSSLESARTGLDDARENARGKLVGVYKYATDALNSAYAKANNAQNFAGLVQRTYFAPQDDDSIRVWQTTQKMVIAVEKIKSSLGVAQASGANGDLDNALSVALDQLAAIDKGIQDIRAICENKSWRDTVSQADKNNLDLHRDYIVAAYAAVNTSRQNVILQKTTNEIAINAAQAAVTSALGSLKTAEEQLGKTVAGPRQEDVAALNAQIEQASAQADLLELQIADSELKSPVAGVVSRLNIEPGETASPAGSSGAVVVLPDNPYEVEVDVYEEDVAKEKIGDLVQITPVALPDVVYGGKVVSIDPVGKIINGVVYYTTTIDFDKVPDGLKPGMTADVVIITARNENALLVPEGAVQKNDAVNFVQIMENGLPRSVKVEIGIRSKGMAEVISGLNKGAEIVIQ